MKGKPKVWTFERFLSGTMRAPGFVVHVIRGACTVHCIAKSMEIAGVA